MHRGQPLALLMRHSETHTCRHTHAAFITYKSKSCNPSAPSPLMNASVAFKAVSFLRSALVRPTQLNRDTRDYPAL